MSEEGQGGLDGDLTLDVGSGDRDGQTPGDGFVYFRMSGGRFDAGTGLPTEAAIELQRYAELVYEVARLKWLEAHPERNAVRGLRDAFDLRLIAIRDGSARPVFRLQVRYDERDTDGDPEPLFLRARDIVNETFGTLARDHVLPADFPRRAIPQLQRIGKTLVDEEAIAFAEPRPRDLTEEPATDAILTSHLRDVIELIDQALETEPEWHEAVGVVSELDGVKGTFRLDLTTGGSLPCRLILGERGVAETVKGVLAADGVTAPDVMVGGLAERNRKGEVTRLSEVSEVAVVRTPMEKAIMNRLDELSGLAPGWWGPGTRAPAEAAVRHARELAPHLAAAAKHVAIGADGDGSIVLEWEDGPIKRSVELLADGDAYYFAYDTTTRRHQELQGPFSAQHVLRYVETGGLDG